ncbi:MAG TPA: DUF4389 domain-containing protein [Gammaproteobacteria bacterium]
MQDERSSAIDDETPERRSQLEENLRRGSTWLRLLFMIVMVVLYAVSRVVTGVVIVLQFCFVLFTGSTNARLLELGQSLATYTYQLIRYLTFVSDERPFPFDLDWPSGRSAP